ncbi:relaxase/mobilization nuclease domain-containing protein [Ruminococcus flavefaciens]|uniref:Relaxase/Mobilisation nuclease domain-containing protein n=1 Tax=Ruminococcus flavefaciens TaxID=1265 RepID=A0A1M7IIV0_RUMFL|nr:relaxase/mobilization nuclease domain-containing protein [Ruminococcus flavefaciens]SHM40523.1 Relaxase/Mobilisation nuclease domain-containing protein [Ruminococcus flavefaciens]
MNTIVKDIYVKSCVFSDVIEMHAYLSDPLKIKDKSNIEGLGFFSDNYLDEFYAIKAANQQMNTTMFRQITISISPVGNTCTDKEYMKIGKEIAEYYYKKGYQIIWYLHKDTPRHHLHLLLNSVNFRTGKIFKQSLKGLNRFKVHCNHILHEHNLEQIQMSVEDMLDITPHELSEGFEIFEIFDEVIADNATVFEELFDEKNTSDDEYYSAYDLTNLGMTTCPSTVYYTSATYEETIIPEPKSTLQEGNTMDYTIEKKEVPALKTSSLPSEVLENTCLVIDASKNVNFTVPSNCDEDKLKDIINSVEPIPEHDRATNAKIGIASIAELQKRGIDLPVYVDTSTNINIEFDDVMSSDIFDTTFTEK